VKVQLPSKRVVEIRRSDAPPDQGVLFAEARALFSPMNVGAMPLADFHALRAIASHERWIDEDEIEIACRNCDAPIVTRPCAAMPLAPFVDAELDDEELDRTLDLSVAHDVPGLGKVRLAPRTVSEAEPFHRALARGEIVVTPAVVSAMGVVAIDDERDRAVITRKIKRCDDRAFGLLGNLFLAAHYPPRLFGLVVCEACGARNDVDAPYDRELDAHEDPREGTDEALPTFDAFDALAREIGAPRIDAAPEPKPALIVDDNVPATDDGGEPLLGSYVPGEPGNPGEITLYYRTFASLWQDDGPYDVAAEIEETIEHELEHHVAALTGHDPKDDEERDEIAREAARVLGKKALARSATRALGSDVHDFLRRTWLLWIVALIVVIIAAIASK